MDALSDIGPRPRNEVPIVLAEDSQLLNKLIVDSLNKAGYNQIRPSKFGGSFNYKTV